MLKGKDRKETFENYSILALAIGAFLASIGIGLTVFSTKGIPAILAMSGSFIAFISTIVLIFSWLAKDFSSGESSG